MHDKVLIYIAQVGEEFVLTIRDPKTVEGSAIGVSYDAFVDDVQACSQPQLLDVACLCLCRSPRDQQIILATEDPQHPACTVQLTARIVFAAALGAFEQQVPES